MLMAVESGAGIRGPGFIHGIPRGPIYDLLENQSDPARIQLVPAEFSSSSSSSIGKDSDASGRESEGDEDGTMGEVQSEFKGVLQGINSLEESLPIRRGISNFYAGKSKSFASLSDAAASSASIKDLAKADNLYARTRRNLLASRIFCERPHKNLLRSPGGGIAKRQCAPTRSALCLAVTMTSGCLRSDVIGDDDDDDDCDQLSPLNQHLPSKSTVVIPQLSSSPGGEKPPEVSRW